MNPYEYQAPNKNQNQLEFTGKQKRTRYRRAQEMPDGVRTSIFVHKNTMHLLQVASQHWRCSVSEVIEKIANHYLAVSNEKRD